MGFVIHFLRFQCIGPNSEGQHRAGSIDMGRIMAILATLGILAAAYAAYRYGIF